MYSCMCFRRHTPQAIKQELYDKELDASQLELRNSRWFEDIEQAKREIIELMHGAHEALAYINQKYQINAHYSESAVPNMDFDPVHSGKESNKFVHKLLMENTEERKCTNVAGIHANVDMSIDEYIAISNEIRTAYLSHNYEYLWASPERLAIYERVVKAGNRNGLLPLPALQPYLESSNDFYGHFFDESGEPIYCHTLMRPKIADSWQLIWEIRTMDWASTINWFLSQADRTEEILAKHGVLCT